MLYRINFSLSESSRSQLKTLLRPVGVTQWEGLTDFWFLTQLRNSFCCCCTFLYHTALHLSTNTTQKRLCSYSSFCLSDKWNLSQTHMSWKVKQYWGTRHWDGGSALVLVEEWKPSFFGSSIFSWDSLTVLFIHKICEYTTWMNNIFPVVDRFYTPVSWFRHQKKCRVNSITKFLLWILWIKNQPEFCMI